MKVGALVLAAVVLLAALVLVIGDFKFERGQTISVDYVFVGSLQTGAAVRTSGIKVGKVEAIEFMGGEKNPKTGEPIQIRLKLWIENRAIKNVRENSRFLINTEGVLGEQYVEIVPGNGDAPLLTSDAIVRGDDPARTDLLMQKAFQLVDGLNNLMGDGDKFQGIIKSLGRLLDSTDKLMSKNEDQIGPLLTNLNKLIVEAQATMSSTGDMRIVLDNTKVITTEFRKEIIPMTADIKQALADLRVAGANTVLLTDPKTGTLPVALQNMDTSVAKFDRTLTGIDGAVDHFDKVVTTVDRAAAQIEHIMARVEAGPARHFLADAPTPPPAPEVKPEPVSVPAK
jgi:phospholipid/cholesterol/gamma-HCH transport system substrate-binding protein